MEGRKGERLARRATVAGGNECCSRECIPGQNKDAAHVYNNLRSSISKFSERRQGFGRRGRQRCAMKLRLENRQNGPKNSNKIEPWYK
jgi:hypothetical protein